MIKIIYKLLTVFMLLLAISLITNILITNNIDLMNSNIKKIAKETNPIEDYSSQLVLGSYKTWIGIFLYSNGDIYFGRQYIAEGNLAIDESVRKLTELNVPTKEIIIKKDAMFAEQNKILDLVDNHPEDKEKIRRALNLLQQRISALDTEINSLLAEAKIDNEISIKITSLVGKNILKTVWLMVFVAFIFSLIIGVNFSNSMSQPILKLIQAAKEIGKGHFDKRVYIKSNDELNVLAHVFDNMRKDLQRSMSELKDLNLHLEKKVKQRTKELDERDEKLMIINKRLHYMNNKLKDLDKQKDAFISLAAHELKTPLTSIKGFAQMLEENRNHLPKKKVDEYLELINDNSERLYKLVLDLVDSSRISLGRLKINKEIVSPDKILKDLKNNMEMGIKEKKLIPIFAIEKNVPPIYADFERILQVLRNLLINAIHYTTKGSIAVHISKKDNNVLFEVKDTGPGIPKESQDQIFSRFYQVDSTMTRKIGGSGLGLSISKGLVELMGGKIWFESTVGKGTAFYFQLPIHKRGKKHD